MANGTVRLQRVLRAPPERVFRAFTTPAALCKWLPPHGYTCEVHELDLRVGGASRASFTHLASGQAHSFGGRYLEIVPAERLAYTDAFDDPALPGTMTTTVTFRQVFCGTELLVVQEGIPAQVPVEACLMGWQESLALLALLVEAAGPAQ